MSSAELQDTSVPQAVGEAAVSELAPRFQAGTRSLPDLSWPQTAMMSRRRGVRTGAA